MPRRFVQRLMLVIVFLRAARTWFIEGLFSSYRVTSGSMAEALRGPHFDVTCRECGFRFACGSDIKPLRRRAVCPNCAAENDLAGRPVAPGDRMLVLKSVFTFGWPRRWQVVAFRDPQQATRLLVKRVVGLPGETVWILDGDVYVDGRIARKSLAQQRALAVLVHDARFGSRWKAEGRWTQQRGVFRHTAAPEECGGDVDWLVYRHQRRALGELVESPVLNELGYNQFDQRSEMLAAVADLMLSMRIANASGPGDLLIRAENGQSRFEVRLTPAERRYVVRENDQKIASGVCPDPAASKQGLKVELSLFDRQFLLALDGSTTTVRPLVTAKRGQPGSRPFAIGASGLEVTLRDVRVYRDAYYLCPVGEGHLQARERTTPLGPNEYYVLGDNSAVSIDSRNWAGDPSISGDLIQGRPIILQWPHR
ncbi:MAG: hypothetical protein KJZ87_15585 [Thermoguttaceae bacterium]|nr:hypothetical protein [Thermoguttaceae bacterium]